ncbi:hypothetical protein [Salipaludibacillus sp. CF4.18]|uniref:hypothetical protein n=1 Tax=Salipaludibacillus sp. CF4.18 TaxID=3373081 RepID=UPI003EE79324
MKGAMVAFLFSLRTTLSAYTMEKTRNSIEGLMTMEPKEATILRDGLEHRFIIKTSLRYQARFL